MSAKTFFTPGTKAQVAATIAEVERQTSAEVVVALRAASGHYRHSDYLAGIALATVSLLVFLFHPAPFDIDVFPLEFAGFFAAGVLISSFFSPLRRVLTSRRLREGNVRTAARAAFVDHGVSRTKGRTGVLVFVSMFERRVEVVPKALPHADDDVNELSDEVQS